MKKFYLIGLFPLLLSLARAVEDSTPQTVLGPFGTLNNNDNALVIPPNMAQDMLNVEVSQNGLSVKKRKGLGLAFTLPIATAPVHGIYNFFDANGSDVSLFFNDRHLTASINGAAITTLFSTGTVDATWQCTDSLGYAYCASTARSPMVKTNGVTATALVMADTGTMVTSTVQRLVTSGFSAAPSQIDFSGANDFTNWTLGGLATSPYTETINAPGSKITHITAACNGLMWFKDTSFGIILNPDDSINAQNVILAPEIGTLDNTSVIYPGGIQFRSQDGHIYNFDCAGIEKLTKDITQTINASGFRRTNSWTQTSQSDFQTGSSSPPFALSTTVSAGDVVPSSFSVLENSSSQWGLGTVSNTTVGTSSISLTLNNNGDITNPDFGAPFAGNWYTVNTPAFTQGCSPALYTCGTVSGQSGSCFVTQQFTSPTTFVFEAIDPSSNSLATVSLPLQNDCAWHQTTLSSSGNVGKVARFRVRVACPACGTGSLLSTVDSYIWGGDLTLYYQHNTNSGGTLHDISVDNVKNGSSTINTGTFTSQAFNTGVPYSYVFSSATWSANTPAPSFVLQKSATGSSGWLDVSVGTNTNTQVNQRYIRYLSTFTVSGGNSNALSAITGVQFIARSSGTYFSAWNNAPFLTSWDTFLPTYSNGDGSQSFYIRSSTSPQIVLNSTVPLTSQTAGAVVSASTGTYFQLIDSFTITSATGTPPSLSNFTINWFEGTAADKPYAIYFGKDNALWWSVAYGDGQSTNNRILRWDLTNRGWVPYDIAASGFLIRNQDLYIGSATAGKIYKFGDTDSDAGVAINSYWKSKDFAGDSPLNDKEFRTLSVVAKSVSASSMTVTYTLNASSSTDYTVYLYNSASSILRNNRYLPAGRVGNTFNVQFGNNAADQYWEVFGLAFKYAVKPWAVGN